MSGSAPRQGDLDRLFDVLLDPANSIEKPDAAQGALDAIRLAPDTARAFRPGPEGCELIAFGAPKPEGQDVEMLPGWWPESG
mgnify:CR=1 FL=1